MSEVFFVLKTFMATFFVVLLMQIRVGASSVEQHCLTWIESSKVVSHLRAVAEGAVQATTVGYQAVAKTVGTTVNKSVDAGLNKVFSRDPSSQPSSQPSSKEDTKRRKSTHDHAGSSAKEAASPANLKRSRQARADRNIEKAGASSDQD